MSDCPECKHCEYPQRDSAECRLNTLKPDDEPTQPISWQVQFTRDPATGETRALFEVDKPASEPTPEQPKCTCVRFRGICAREGCTCWHHDKHNYGGESPSIQNGGLGSGINSIAAEARKYAESIASSGVINKEQVGPISDALELFADSAIREALDSRDRELAELRARADKLNHAMGHINMLILKAYNSGSIQDSVDALNGIRAILAADITGTAFCPAESQLAAAHEAIPEQSKLAAAACLGRLEMSEGDRGYYIKLLAEPIAASMKAALSSSAPAAEAHNARVRTEALRDAADAKDRPMHGQSTWPEYLHKCADAIESSAGTPTYQPRTFMEKGLGEIIGNENAEIRRLNERIRELEAQLPQARTVIYDQTTDGKRILVDGPAAGTDKEKR